MNPCYRHAGPQPWGAEQLGRQRLFSVGHVYVLLSRRVRQHVELSDGSIPAESHPVQTQSCTSRHVLYGCIFSTSPLNLVWVCCAATLAGWWDVELMFFLFRNSQEKLCEGWTFTWSQLNSKSNRQDAVSGTLYWSQKHIHSSCKHFPALPLPVLHLYCFLSYHPTRPHHASIHLKAPARGVKMLSHHSPTSRC